MSLLAALAVGVFCFLAAGRLLGHPVEIGRWPRTGDPHDAATQWLLQAGTTLTPLQFLGGSTAVGIAVFAAVAFVTGAPLVALVPAAAAALVPRAYFTRRRITRLRELQSSWPDALRDLASSISAGSSLTHALTALAETGPPVLRDAFSRFPTLARMLGPVAALEVVKAELADPTSDRVVEVLVLAQERGGAIVTSILDDLVAATTRDVKLLDEIDSQALEMKINARAVLVLPWLVLVALTLRGGAFRDFYGSPGGLFVIGIGALLSAFGAWWIGRLGRAQQEARVFGLTRPSGAMS